MYEQITRKQAGVLYRAWKESKVEMTEEQVNKMYDLTKYNGYDDCGDMQWRNDRLQLAIEYFFEGDLEGTNRQIKMAFMR